MEFTLKQEEAIRVTTERYNRGEKYTVISGYAGTGKSTSVAAIVQSLPHIDPDVDVVYTSFTGKAVNVLRQKGNKNVSTLHRLLYMHKMLPNGKFIKTNVDFIPYRVVVVDEVSMVSMELIQDLFKYPVYVIFLGDPGQLPPIDKKNDNHLLDTPHIFLEEVVRQAAESDIIRLTMQIRDHKPIAYQKSNEVIVASKGDLSEGMLSWADIVLCGTNRVRNSLNQQMRELCGMRPEVLVDEGEKIICLQNYWEHTAGDDGPPLMNGTIGYASNVFEQNFYPPKGMRIKDNKIPIISATFTSEIDDNFGIMDMDKYEFSQGKPYLSPQEHYRLYKNHNFSRLIPKSFTYGYAITCHKAQGSEWEKVLVYEESFPYDKEEHARWLYTAATRSSKKLILIR